MPYSYSNLQEPWRKPGKKYTPGKVGGANFRNAKAGTSTRTGRSSAVPTAKSNWGYQNMSIHSEPARQGRLGKSTSPSGPKRRKK